MGDRRWMRRRRFGCYLRCRCWRRRRLGGSGRAPATSSPPAIRTTRQSTRGWQAGTCNDRTARTGAESARSPPPNQFFETAAGHPNWGFTQFIVKHTRTKVPRIEKPVGELKTVRVDLPVGLSVNPRGDRRCPLAVFEAGASPAVRPGRRSAKARVTASTPLVGPVAPIPA